VKRKGEAVADHSGLASPAILVAAAFIFSNEKGHEPYDLIADS
jgi:hypothetical protein